MILKTNPEAYFFTTAYDQSIHPILDYLLKASTLSEENNHYGYTVYSVWLPGYKDIGLGSTSEFPLAS